MMYWLKRILHAITLGVFKSPCPDCQEGYLHYYGMDYDTADNEINIYKCDHCNKEFY